MLHSYICLLLTCGIAIAQPSWKHTPAELKRVLGPLGDNFARLPFNCPALTPSPTVPTSAHAVRPADIKYIAAMGDSLTAANGAKAVTIIGLYIEYRGVSWCIGGDANLDSVVTLPNILRKYNNNLFGYSKATGNQDSANAVFNVAKPGAISVDMPGQAILLVDRMKKALGANFATDWKLVTFFIGGNDLCDCCKDPNKYSTAAYTNNVKTALDYLQNNMPRTIVNFVTVLNVAELEDLHDGWMCETAQKLLCDCAVNKDTREMVRRLTIEYQQATNQLIDSGRYDTKDDFTVVCQPFMEHMTTPITHDGSADFTYFTHDCFHFSQKGHASAAIELWNNMMQPCGQKTTYWLLDDTLKCPSSGNGYIYTSKNSN